MVLTVSFVISPAIGFLAAVANARFSRRKLDTSIEVPGPHDFTVRQAPFVSWHSTSIAFPANVRDDRETPL